MMEAHLTKNNLTPSRCIFDDKCLKAPILGSVSTPPNHLAQLELLRKLATEMSIVLDEVLAAES